MPLSGAPSLGSGVSLVFTSIPYACNRTKERISHLSEQIPILQAVPSDRVQNFARTKRGRLAFLVRLGFLVHALDQKDSNGIHLDIRRGVLSTKTVKEHWVRWVCNAVSEFQHSRRDTVVKAWELLRHR